jgi:AcrR family transcriptional regulator
MEARRQGRKEVSRAAPRMRKADRRRQLLGHAKQLFATLGYAHTTTEKIAQAAGVTEPVLYRHFNSKKALLLEVLQEVRQATLDRWHAETAGISDPLVRLHSIVEMYLGSTRSQALELHIMHRTLVEIDDEEIAASLRQFYLESETLLTRVIREGQAAGIFRAELDARVGAWELIRTALGYTLTLPLEIPLYQETTYLSRAVECMLRCLLP